MTKKESRKTEMVGYRVSKDIAKKMDSISNATATTRTKVFEAMVDAVYLMSIGEAEKLIDEVSFLNHFQSTKKLAENLKAKVKLQMEKVENISNLTATGTNARLHKYEPKC
tara:strand:- start:263 stop:595 length:333 start_codon:yes stop_codon:yes gene_type:complete